MFEGQHYLKMVNNALSDIQKGAHRVNFAELIYQLAIREMDILISQARKVLTRTETLQLHRGHKMNSNRKEEIKNLPRPKKYHWSCKCSSFWHRLLEVEFGIEYVRSAAEDTDSMRRPEQQKIFDRHKMSTSE
jgi:hypothetical protein